MSGGSLAALGWTRESHPALGWLPQGTFARAFVLGLGCAVLLGPASVWALGQLNVSELTLWSFVGFKAAFAGILALLVTPVISLWAMTAPA